MPAFDADMHFSRLASQEAARRFLSDRYAERNLNEAQSYAYSNAQAFLHYTMHGQDLYEQGRKLPQSMQPLLFFYGLAHLVKACLLTVRPCYPEQTSQLAHGVSARKRKKRDFSFLGDEVKIQHQGLFPYFSRHLFDIGPFSETKVGMDALIRSIPEMQLLMECGGSPALAKVGRADDRRLFLPDTMCTGHEATWKTMMTKIEPHLSPVESFSESREGCELLLAAPAGFMHGPFFATGADGSIYAHLAKSPAAAMTELMIHYLLLYNLSMLSRYETEWWGELFALKADIDYQAISVYLKTAAFKVPFLAAKWLEQATLPNRNN